MARRRLFNQCFYITYENTKYFPCIEIFSALPTATVNLAPEGGEFVFSLTSSHVWEVAAAQSHPFFNIIEVDGVAVAAPKVTGESGTHVIKVRVSANPGTNPRQSGLYVTQFLNKDHMSAAATGSLFSGDLYSRRITVNVFEQGSGAYVLINGATGLTENISYDTTSRQYTITSRGGWHFVDASIGQSCTSDITGVTTTDEDSTLITVTYGQNTGGSDREFLFQIVSNQDSSIVASAVISQAGLVLLDLERVDNDTLPWVGTNLDDTTTWPSLPQYYQYWSPQGVGYVYTYSGSNLINVSANTPVNLTLPSRISVSENPITGSGSYSKQISFSGAALDSGLTDDTGYTYLMSGVSSVNSSVQDTVSFHYEPWPYIEVVPTSGPTPGPGQGGETHGGNDGYVLTGGTFMVDSACTGFSFELASNYEVRENPYADTNDLFNVTLTGRKVDITFKYDPESASTDVTRWADFVVSGLSGPIVLRRFPITRQAAQHTVSHYFEVLPTTATISSAGTLQLTALYHTVTDGVDDGGVNVTTNTTWVDMSDTPHPFFTVGRNTGLVTGTNTIENAQTGRVVATYNTYTGETSITVLGTGTTTYYLEVTPVTATIGPTGTTNLTAKFYTVVNGVPDAGTDVTSLATWSSDNTAATVSAGVVTGHNNNPNSSAVANITATYNGYSDDSVITVQPAVITYNYFIIRPQGSTRLNTGDTVDGQPVIAEITRYINGEQDETLDVTSATTWGVSDSSVIIAGTAGSNPQHVYPVYESGTYYPNDRTAELSGTCVIDGQTFRDTQSFIVSPEGRVEYLLAVTPQSTSLLLNETQQLTVMYYTITDGVTGTGVNVTNLATYSNYDTSLITVSSNGLITDINAGSEASTTITVAYGNADSVTVSVLARDTQTTHTVELTPSMETFTVSGVVRYTVQYVTYVNGQETNRETITGNEGLSWNLTDTANIATFNGSLRQMFVENLSTTNRGVELQATYQGTTSNTATVTVRGATTLVRYLNVDRDTGRIPYSGSVQLSVSSITEVNGDVYGWSAETPQNITWTMSPTGYGSLNGFTFTADNTGHTEIDQYLYAYKNAGTADEITGSTSFIIEAKPDIVEYALRLLQNGDSTLSQAFNWNGLDVFTIVLSKYVNGEWVEDIREITTTGDGATWSVNYPYPDQHADTYTTWDANAQTLQGHNLSNQRIIVNVSASWQSGSTLYSTHVATVSFRAPSSIEYRVVVSASTGSVAYNGSTPVSATYVTIVENVVYEPASVDVTTNAGTVWSLSPTGYGSVSNGTFYGNNATDAAQTVTLTATYNNLSDSVDITVGTDTVSHRLVVVSADDQVVYSGSTQLTATYQTLVGGVLYSEVDVTTNAGTVWSLSPTGYGSVSNGTFYGNNLTDTDRTITVTAVYNSKTDSTTIEVLAWPDEITHNNLRLAQDTATTATTISLTSGGSDSHYGLYWDEYNHNVFVEPQNVTQYGSYSLYSGSTLLATFDCSATGTRYSDAFLDISYTNVNGITFSAHNDDHENKAYNLVSQRTGMNASTSISIEKAADVITHEVLLVSSTGSTSWSGTVEFTPYYLTFVNYVETGRTVLNANDITWVVNDQNTGIANLPQGSTSMTIENLTSNDVTVSVYFTYDGMTANTVNVLSEHADVTYRLAVSAAATGISYNATTQMSALYWTVVNGTDYRSENVTNATSWSDDSQYASVDSSGLFTANNNTNTAQTVTVTGAYNSKSSSAEILVGRQPEDLTYSLQLIPNIASINSWSGSMLFMVVYITMDNGEVISRENVPSASLVGTWNISSDGITSAEIAPNDTFNSILTVENVSIATKTVYLYTTYRGLTSNTATTTVIGVTSVDYVLDVSTDDVIITSAGTTNANAIYKTIVDGSYVYSSSDVTSETTWSITNGTEYASIGQNTGVVTGTNHTASDQSVTIQGVYDSVTGTTSITVESGPAITYGLEIVGDTTTQAYSGTNAFTAWYCTYEDNVRIASADVTSNAVWSVSSTGGDFVRLGVTGGSVEFVNLSAGTGNVTVVASYSVGANTYTGNTGFDVSGVVITVQTEFTDTEGGTSMMPDTLTVNEIGQYVLNITIRHNGNVVYTTNAFTFESSNDNFLLSTDPADPDETFAVINDNCYIEGVNNTGGDIIADVVGTYRENSPVYLPTGDSIEDRFQVTFQYQPI